MLDSSKPSHFFLSTNSPQGYYSCFDHLYKAKDGWKAYILMGGFDVGKSAMFDKIGSAFQAAGQKVEYIHSCIDPDSFDAIALPEVRTCFIDGDMPNNFTIQYPGVTETIVNLGEHLDESVLLKGLENILLFTARVNNSSDRAYRFLMAASSLLSDTCRLTLECTDLTKLENYAMNLSRHEFQQKSKQGVETQRFLSAITPDGIKNLSENLAENYEHIYEIEDEYGIGRIFINKLRCAALAAGYDVISCSCPITPEGKPEHLLIPSLSLAYITTGHYHPYTLESTRHIHMRRFIDREALKLKRPRISFNRKASRELIDEAVILLDDARANRQMIKSYYAQATDHSAIDKKADKFIESLLTKAVLK